MLRSWQERVDDMLGAIDEIAVFVGDMDFASFVEDRKTQKAVVADLYVVGETAARLLKDAATRRGGSVPWDRLAALRSPLLEGRLLVDTAALWKTLEELPALVAPLRALAGTPFEDELPSLD